MNLQKILESMRELVVKTMSEIKKAVRQVRIEVYKGRKQFDDISVDIEKNLPNPPPFVPQRDYKVNYKNKKDRSQYHNPINTQEDNLGLDDFGRFDKI